MTWRELVDIQLYHVAYTTYRDRGIVSTPVCLDATEGIIVCCIHNTMHVNDQSIERAACVAGSLRRAARSVTRLYDGHLTPAGLTTTQLSILCTIQRHGGRLGLSALATDLVFERTSLYRALAPLRRAGLLAVRLGADVRTREAALTASGRRRIAKAMPYWVAAQRTVLDRLGEANWRDLAKRIGEIAAIARTPRPQ